MEVPLALQEQIRQFPSNLQPFLLGKTLDGNLNLHLSHCLIAETFHTILKLPFLSKEQQIKGTVKEVVVIAELLCETKLERHLFPEQNVKK